MTKATASKRFYFYQRAKIATVKGTERDRTLFSGGEGQLAELLSMDSDQAQLLATESTGSVIRAKHTDPSEPLVYTAYGYSSSLPSEQTSTGFNGEFFDALEFYPLGAGYRLYYPPLMRLFSPDNLSPFAQGGINSYAYCGGDPVNFTDPSGHAPNHSAPPSLSKYLAKPRAAPSTGSRQNNVRAINDDIPASYDAPPSFDDAFTNYTQGWPKYKDPIMQPTIINELTTNKKEFIAYGMALKKSHQTAVKNVKHLANKINDLKGKEYSNLRFAKYQALAAELIEAHAQELLYRTKFTNNTATLDLINFHIYKLRNPGIHKHYGNSLARRNSI